MDWNKFLLVFIPIFVAMDTIGAIPVFISLTAKLSRVVRRKIIIQAVSTSFALGTIFVFFGRNIFNFLNITKDDFKVAGGLLLLVLAMKAIMEDDVADAKVSAQNAEFLGIVPFAMPLIIGPAVLTTLVILNDSHGPYWTSLSLILNLAVITISFSYSRWINKLIGKNGEKILSKIANIFMAAIGIMMMRSGILEMVKTFMDGLK